MYKESTMCTNRKPLHNEFQRLNLVVMAVQETKIQKTKQVQINAPGGRILTLYNSGHRSWKGVGILVERKAKINFNAVNKRICYAHKKTKI